MSPSTHPRTPRLRSPRTRAARRLALVAAAALAVTPVLALAPAPSASAVTGQAGWIRLAHLSPDTKAVDVELTALRGGDTVFELDGVGYGAVSPYTDLPEGVYTVSMVPSDAAEGSDPVLSASVRVTAGKSVTVAAYGPNDDLDVSVFDDDLTTPSAGQARIRLVQASTITPRVDVATSTGIPIAEDAEAGSATNYAEVPAGPWTLELSGRGVEDEAEVALETGSVTTLFVLDTADGGLTILPVLDSAAVGQVPVGSVATGGGALADEFVDAPRGRGPLPR